MRRPLLVLVALAVAAAAVHAEESTLSKLDREIRRLAADAGRAVVRVRVERELPFPGDEADGPPVVHRVSRIGTGFLVDAEGHILSTHQLVEGATGARVSFPGEEPREARILGSDPFFQVAVLKTRPAPGVKPLVLRQDEPPPFATLTLFLGHSFGTAESAAIGLVTGTGRSGHPFHRFDNYITVNTAVHPGDTGGPFLDAKGRVLGMAVEARPGIIGFFGRRGEKGGGIQGFGSTAGPACAVPAPDLRFALQEIRAHGRVRSGRLGVLVWRDSLKVRSVHPGTPAAKAGLGPDDVILAVNDRPVTSGAELSRVLRRLPVGTEVRIRYRRGEEERTGRAIFEEYFAPSISPLPGIAVTIGENGITVSTVDEKRARFAVRVGDRIVDVDGERVVTGDDLAAVLEGLAKRPSRIAVVRAGLRITLAARAGGDE